VDNGELSLGDHQSFPTPTYAVLDLGGASTQIVFKPRIRSLRKGSISTTFSSVGNVICCTDTRI